METICFGNSVAFDHNHTEFCTFSFEGKAISPTCSNPEAYLLAWLTSFNPS